MVIATCRRSGIVLFSGLRLRPGQFKRLRSEVVLRCPACRAPHVFDRSGLRLSED